MNFTGPIGLAYLIAALSFILGLKMLGSPVTAVAGQRAAMAGMAIAIVATLFEHDIRRENFPIIGAGMVVGAVLGIGSARKVKMTAMPEMVAIFNGMGGGAAAMVSGMEFGRVLDGGQTQAAHVASTGLGAAIGSISFAGSVIAFLKLREIMKGNAIKTRWGKYLNGVLGLVIVAAGLVITLDPHAGYALPLFLALVVAALLLGLALVVPIGGADMPVVVSLMNSLTGLATALTGFVLSNELLIVAGALVGASGTVLTQLMAKAMNRPITNVLFGGFGAAAGTTAELPEGATIRQVSADDAAVLMSYSSRVVIVPGYGLAVAQAQHQLRELADLLCERGVEVKYAIHPVAGRMPGHMNVLLAEADVPYDQVFEMDQINGEFCNTDVVLAVGANDIINPAARDDPSSSIYGMPILNVDQAQNVIVLKRSMRSGFAGIDNALFYNPRTSMLFGDAKDSLLKLRAAVKATAKPRGQRSDRELEPTSR